MIDSARNTGTTLSATTPQLPPHRLQDSGIQASAMRYVVPSGNAAENPRPQRGGADWAASEAFFQRSRYYWFRPKPQRYLSPPELRLISWSMFGLTDGTVLVPHPPKRLAGRLA